MKREEHPAFEYAMHRSTIICFVAVILTVAAVPAACAPSQVTGLAVRHSHGQTFITWSDPYVPELPSDVDDRTAHQALTRANKGKTVRYRIYRSDKTIRTTESLTPIAEVGIGTCWNFDYYGIDDKTGVPAYRYVVCDGDEPLAPDTGLYVHNPTCPDGPEEAWYAVTLVTDGRENPLCTPENTTQDPLNESKGPGRPVLQRIVKPDDFSYIEHPTLHYYVRWEAPPRSSVENRPIDYLVAIPPHIESTPTPVGLHLHCWGGSLDGGYGWWYQYARLGTTYLISSSQIPYDWWTGYHERYYSGERSEDAWKQGVVRPYTTTRMLSFLDWATTQYNLDTNRVFTAGSSMGGSGAPMFAIRHSSRIAWSVGWVGVHDPGNTPQFEGSYAQVYGDKSWNIPFENGTPAFEYYRDAAYLRSHPNEEIGFITWSNGKNDGGIGWPQAVEFLKAMQQTHRPHIFVWGLRGHGQRASMPANSGERVMPIDIRLDRSLPAFTRCSLDDNPGTAAKLDTPRKVTIEREPRQDPYDGDPQGQINLYLSWDGNDIIDTPDRWEMTVILIPEAPEEKCLVDVTPRRLQKFKAAPQEAVRWIITDPAGGTQTGRAAVDRWGLVTLEQVIITKGPNRVCITR